jgi:GNAT superfamily N-acetyltransferase
MIINRFQDSQAEEVAELIKRNLLEIISEFYTPAYVASLVDSFSPTNILENAKTQQIIVAMEDGKVIGTGSLANYGSTEIPSYYGTAIFVAPEAQGKGIGRQIMQNVEAQAVEMGADKIIVRAARNARAFYEKLGYTYVDGIAKQDEKGNYVMEKVLQNQT